MKKTEKNAQDKRGDVEEIYWGGQRRGCAFSQRSLFRLLAHGAACGKAFFAQIFLEGVVS
jgi:hypothetical protein